MTHRLSASDIILAAGATIRLTRFMTSDKLPEELALRHVRTHAEWHADGRPANLAGYVNEAIDCPFCGGFWIGLIVLAVTWACPRGLRPLLRLVFGALGLNYIVGHVSSRLDH